MTSIQDMLGGLAINSATSVAMICAYAVLKDQPINKRVYYAKWVKMGVDAGPQNANPKNRRAGRYINLNLNNYMHVMDWIKHSFSMSEDELIQHAGLDSAIFLRLLLLGIKIFVPMMVYSFVVLVPINVTDDQLAEKKFDNQAFTYSSLDTITVANIPNKSSRLWAHIVAAYLYTAWTCWLLFRQYRNLVTLRFTFLTSQDRSPDQFTILCRCIPTKSAEPIKTLVDKFFLKNHPDHYLLSRLQSLPQLFTCINYGQSSRERIKNKFVTVVYNANKLSRLVAKKESYKNKVTYLDAVISRASSPTRPTQKTGFLGLWGERVDSLQYYSQQIDELTDKIRNERMRVLEDEKSVMPAAFVSFETRWAAAVCSQTVQSKDSSKWLTDWAPQPRDVYWGNLPIPYLQLNSRKLISLALLIILIIFFLIPVSFVQSLANLDKIESTVHFLRPLIELKWVKTLIQGFLAGLALKIFLAILPYVVWYLALFEGHVSYSRIEKHSCINYLAFMLVNVFLGNVLTGSAFQQLKLFINTPTQIPSVLGQAIPQRSTFFITYIMVDGWTNTASELLRVLPLIIYQFRNLTMLRTERDRDEATPVDFINYTVELPRLGLYFLLGFVYSTISPLILPFILVHLASAYVVYRNQIINAYDQRYESAGQYWPVMFAYVIIGLLVMDATLIGLMALKQEALSTPFLLPLPFITILFWVYCKSRFEGGFRCYPLEEAKKKDNIETAREPNLDKIGFLGTAYMHPALRTTLTGVGTIDESDSEAAVDELLHRSPVHGYPRNSDENSSGKGWRRSRRNSEENWSNRSSLTERRLLSPGSLTPNRPMPVESSTPIRQASAEISSPNRQGSNRYSQGSIPGGKEYSTV